MSTTAQARPRAFGALDVVTDSLGHQPVPPMATPELERHCGVQQSRVEKWQARARG